LIKTAKQTNLKFAPTKLSRNLKKQLPAWTHIGAQPKTYNAKRDDCLKNTHNATTIHQINKSAKRLRKKPNHQDPHTERSNCKCKACKSDRLKGCKNPHKCAIIANNIIKKLAPIYNHRREPKFDNLTLTHRRIEKNQKADVPNGDEIIFDPSITTKESLGEGFRIL
ncbi:hypothetical protein BJ138DRAFT_974891, partial [Hygrophoropsis aurantiaca]